jgi:outer membrane protein TolC
VSRARTDLAELERRIRTEASQAATELHVALEQIAAARQGVTAAREARRVQRDLLDAGEATAQQALDAQAALTRAEQSFVDAQIAARIARARADYVVGRATPK